MLKIVNIKVGSVKDEKKYRVECYIIRVIIINNQQDYYNTRRTPFVL